MNDDNIVYILQVPKVYCLTLLRTACGCQGHSAQPNQNDKANAEWQQTQFAPEKEALHTKRYRLEPNAFVINYNL